MNDDMKDDLEDAREHHLKVENLDPSDPEIAALRSEIIRLQTDEIAALRIEIARLQTALNEAEQLVFDYRQILCSRLPGQINHLAT